MPRKPSPIKIGINGFGRIGRMSARILLAGQDFELVVVNDIAEDVENLVYLYNYDAVYGRAPEAALNQGNGSFRIGGKTIAVTSQRSIDEVPWEKHGVDIVIESSGVGRNVAAARQLVDDGRVRKVIVTNSPGEGIDRYIVFGLNDGDYDDKTDRVVSSSICDTSAIAHPLNRIERDFGIDNGFVTTLHPWLSYQNLVDAPLPSQTDPQHFWKDYSLGRSSIGSLIPKNTTAIDALAMVLPDVASKLTGFSYRVPTAIVSSADMTLRLKRAVTAEELRECLIGLSEGNPNVDINHESLISIDFKQCDATAVIDLPWLKVRGDMVKIILWYDNEWGYCNRVVDLAGLMGRKFK